MQLSLVLEEPRARSRDPQTSKVAASSAKQLQADHHATILAALRLYGPAGKDRSGALTNLSGTQVCRRLTELERIGACKPTGRTVLSTAGRQEREWQILINYAGSSE